ncbi:uncharacterized protein LOC126722664 [Quercus robur]|uniref:uncharacterized protein LOC126722664 n=1 Tax=Quercus robur TaxID=38942 RepID=UPI002161C881|nr:uncharacterized protein LOC126722664 [Quercus robur]
MLLADHAYQGTGAVLMSSRSQIAWGCAVLCLPKPPPHHTPELTATEFAGAVRGAWKQTGAAVSQRPKGGSTLADLQQALEDYLPVLLGLVKDGSHLQYKVQFVWVNQEDDAEETCMSNAWYEVLSVLHLMAMLSLSQANLLLLPRTSADGYQPKVSEGDY